MAAQAEIGLDSYPLTVSDCLCEIAEDYELLVELMKNNNKLTTNDFVNINRIMEASEELDKVFRKMFPDPPGDL